MNWETLLALGDSITIGSRSYLGYPECAGKELEAHTHKHWSIHNFSVSGYTCIDLNRYLSLHYANIVETRPEVISILIGTNDAKKGTNPDNYRTAYDQLLTKTRLINRESRLIMIKIPGLREGVVFPYTMQMNETIDTYNQIIEQLAGKHGAELLSFQLESEHFFDGVHLNDVGSHAAGQQLARCILTAKGMPVT